MTQVRRYFARVRDIEGDHPKHGGDWFRVYTHANPSGLYGTRAKAQEVLETAIANYRLGKLAGHTADILVTVDDTLATIKVDDWLVGNVVKIADVPVRYRAGYRDTLKRAALAASRYGSPIYVSSSFRTYEEQVALWNRYLNGGPLAARPGTSDHEFGLALDIPNARINPELIRELRKLGLIDNVPSEIWHVKNTMFRRLDWTPFFDERSRNYPVAAVAAPNLISMTWETTVVLNQGTEGACTGFATAHELNVHGDEVDDEFALTLYRRAQQIDEWPGEDYSGSSVLAAVTAARELGHVEEFRWAFGEADLALALSSVGPAIIGVPWYEGMSDPDREGYLHPTGEQVGGHAILVKGVDFERDAYLLLNSWGPEWGIDGEAWISRADMRKLLANGEACIVYNHGS